MAHILQGIDLFLIGYADDILNLSMILHGLERSFIKLQQEYVHLMLISLSTSV